MKTDKLYRVRLVKSLLTTGQLVGLRQACRRVAIGLAVFSLALVLLGTAWAADGDLDLSFNPGAGVSNIPILWSPNYYSDGSTKMIIAGDFTAVDGVNRTSIARIYSDGSLDGSFNAPVTGQVFNSILLNPGLANSQILIAGDFSIPSDTGPYYGLARLNCERLGGLHLHPYLRDCPGCASHWGAIGR